MTLASIGLLTKALAEPHTLPQLGLGEWDLLIRQARSADVLARIAEACETGGLWPRVPDQPKMHLLSAATVARRQHIELNWEIAQIAEALAPTGVGFVLLKGAAYVKAGMLAAKGRMMSDVDILVGRAMLSEVESALMLKGWKSAAKSDYDQRYYREWMHELPPMRHVHRNTVIDVHHAIVPLTSRSHPSSASLLEAAVPVEFGSKIKYLAPVDMVLHSATHLFHEGELEQGFRGLVDLDCLLRELGRDAEFWLQLVPRAIALELQKPLFYGLRYTRLMLDTPLPEQASIAVAAAPGTPKFSVMLAWMDFLFLRALRPPHPSTADRWTPFARWALYLRGHWLRMPPALLVVHLTRKLFAPKPAATGQN